MYALRKLLNKSYMTTFYFFNFNGDWIYMKVEDLANLYSLPVSSLPFNHLVVPVNLNLPLNTVLEAYLIFSFLYCPSLTNNNLLVSPCKYWSSFFVHVSLIWRTLPYDFYPPRFEDQSLYPQLSKSTKITWAIHLPSEIRMHVLTEIGTWQGFHHFLSFSLWAGFIDCYSIALPWCNTENYYFIYFVQFLVV